MWAWAHRTSYIIYIYLLGVSEIFKHRVIWFLRVCVCVLRVSIIHFIQSIVLQPRQMLRPKYCITTSKRKQARVQKIEQNNKIIRFANAICRTPDEKRKKNQLHNLGSNPIQSNLRNPFLRKFCIQSELAKSISTYRARVCARALKHIEKNDVYCTLIENETPSVRVR